MGSCWWDGRRMKYVYFGNGKVGCEILRWLVDLEGPPVALVVHPPERSKYRTEIIQASGIQEDRIFQASDLRNPDTLAAIKDIKSEIGISVLLDYILKKKLLSVFPKGCINLHPSYLPYNRGQYPNVWSIVEETPSGVSLHYIDEGIDTGDIIARREVPVAIVDTGETLYRKLESAMVELFKDTWPAIRAGNAPPVNQKPEPGTYHKTRDVDSIDKIEFDRSYTARELINILRARTFPPYRGAYVIHEGRRVYLQLSLEEESTVDS